MEYLQYGVDALSLGSLYALFALGVAMVFSIVRLINFAHGELLMIGGFSLLFLSGLPTVFRIAASAGIVIVAALAMERIAFRPVRGARDETLLVTSFAVSYLLQSIAIVAVGATPRSVGVLPKLATPVDVGGLSVPLLDIVSISLTAICLIALPLFLKRTSMGVQIRAAAENFRMARCLGVPANRVIAAAFAISGLLAFVGSLLLTSQTGLVSTGMGTGPVFAAFVATILGGMGSMAGAVAGAYILGGLTMVFQAALPLEVRSYRDAFVFGILVLVLVFRPNGLIQSAAGRQRVV
ncbi:branched-chain amino acid ABC transporter permease [Planotetraspora sp. GP83]|uniref:branched-chain amino acid ABC transporter permease n=1 Tax=Planotetraspora sp. GP83 TaxID=3156264 RepID=UPI003517C1DB